LYQQGLLDDEGFEQTTEFARWASAYEMQMERQSEFEARSCSFITELKERRGGPVVCLRPNPQLYQP
jgi:hypothetical protein